MKMIKSMQVKDIVARMLDKRPEEESCEHFCRRIGLETTYTVRELGKRKDIYTGIAYRIAKALGYQMMFYNPNPPEGMAKCYVVDNKRCPIQPREEKRQNRYSVDTYGNGVFKYSRKYKKKKPKLKKVE